MNTLLRIVGALVFVTGSFLENDRMMFLGAFLAVIGILHAIEARLSGRNQR